ncbi:MAG: PadR family transcriptional regulator [Candidatus Methanoperedens sp.]|nr:PadR family transcriptional regulator [Candidatus Methanoperedens sp.]MCE8428536.1 PadR family transcriptional regulator [Candidatus Methanoperedens sp.]
MNTKPPIVPGIDAILEGAICKSRHALFLYTSLVNRYAIQASFLASSRKDEQLLYITEKDPSMVMDQFYLGHELLVIHPENIGSLKTTDSLRMIIDGIESHEKLDILTGNENNTALCMYDLSRLPAQKVRELAAGHSRLILNTPDMAILSSGLFDRSGTADDTIDRLVKEYLDIVILALVAGKPMCGTDIMDIVHRNFNVLLSPGTIYPLLHRLKKEGLLECDCNIKKKVYKPAKGSEAHIRDILDGHLLANEFLSGFVRSTSSEAR